MRILRVVEVCLVFPRARDLRFLERQPVTYTMGHPRVRIEGRHRMRSDEMARNSVLYRPFNSYVYVLQDSTKVVIDSVNFIGPLLKKR